MKVRELIELLQKCDPEKAVLIDTCVEGEWFAEPIGRIDDERAVVIVAESGETVLTSEVRAEE